MRLGISLLRTLLCLSLLVAIAACQPSPRPTIATTTAQLAAIDRLPPSPLLTIDGQRQLLDDARDHRPALINFWATWCESCVEELPALGRLAARAPMLGAVVLGVAVGEEHAVVARYVVDHPLGYLSLVDENFTLTDAIGARTVPTTLVVDSDGHVVHRGGALDEDALDALARVAASRRSSR